MRILTVNAADLEGGAARAAYRLHVGLQRLGHDPSMLVQGRTSDDHRVMGPRTRMEKFMARTRPLLDGWPARRYPGLGNKLFSPSWLPGGTLVERINAHPADVVHFHWITAGMLRPEDLLRVRKPMVWSLHDMWAFTGGCHYDEECGRWKQACGACPMLGSSKEHDLSRRVHDRKRRAFAQLKDKLTVVGLSRWMASCASQSSLMRDLHVVNLPNPIDTQAFKPVDRRVAKEILGLPLDRPLVLFGAVNATADPRKGFAHLSAALKNLPVGSVELAVLGASRPAVPPDLGHAMHYIGRLHDDASLCVLYNAADVTVVPSLQENLSNTVVESLACGTPVVAFNIGGNSDMVDHGVNGALAPAFDADAMAEGIRWVLEPLRKEALRTAARSIAVERFGETAVCRRYEALYEQAIARYRTT